MASTPSSTSGSSTAPATPAAAGSPAPTRAEPIVKRGPEQARGTQRQRVPGDDGSDIRFFDGTIVKINRDGREVLSDHVGPGERLRREVDDTDRHLATKPAADPSA